MLLSLIELGRFADAVRHIEDPGRQAVPDFRGAGQLALVRAELALACGQPDVAVRWSDDYIARAPAGDANVVFGRLTRAWACVESGRDPGPPIEPQTVAILAGVTAETEGLALLVAGSPGEAAARFVDAASLWRGLHRRGELRCRWAAGDALIRSGDAAAGRALLDEVEVAAAAHGMVPLSARVRQSIRAAGGRRSAVRSRRGVGSDGELSGREREVLVLVAEGLSNAAIAQRLRLSARTVEAQIHSGSAKLAAGRRAHAASLVTDGIERVPRRDRARRRGAAVAAERADLVASGVTVVDGFDAADVGPGVACVGAVSSSEGAANAVLAAVHGAQLLVLAHAPAR